MTKEEISKEIIRLAGLLTKPDKMCSIEDCNLSHAHFHCSECQSTNGNHAQQCNYLKNKNQY